MAVELEIIIKNNGIIDNVLHINPVDSSVAPIHNKYWNFRLLATDCRYPKKNGVVEFDICDGYLPLITKVLIDLKERNEPGYTR